jgi:hypothetical protein
VKVWQKIWKYKPKKKWMGYTAKIIAFLILLFGIYEMKQTNFINSLSSSASIVGINSQQMAGHNRRPDFQGFNQKSGEKPGKNGQRPQGHGLDENGPDGHGASLLGVVTTYTGIMSVFVILTYYLKKVTSINRRNGFKSLKN